MFQGTQREEEYSSLGMVKAEKLEKLAMPQELGNPQTVAPLLSDCPALKPGLVRGAVSTGTGLWPELCCPCGRSDTSVPPSVVHTLEGRVQWGRRGGAQTPNPFSGSSGK